MSNVNSGLALIGGALQAAKGAAAAQPAYRHGVTSGTVVTATIEQDVDDVTSGTRSHAAFNRTGANVGFDVETRLYPASAGLWLMAALGAVAESGAAPAYVHTFTVGDVLPYLTSFGQFGAGARYRVTDAKLNELTISWSNTDPLTLALSGMGVALEFDQPAYAGGTDDTSSRYFVPVAGTFKIAATGTAPVEARVNAGSLHFTNNVNPVVVSSKILPDDQAEGLQDIELSMTVVPDDMSLWREIVTGSPTGTGIADCPAYGSFEWTFVDPCDPVTGAKLVIAGSKVGFTADFPSVDTGGAPATVEAAGIPLKPAAGSAITATLTNAVDTYAAA